jgi:hypothetical protein
VIQTTKFANEHPEAFNQPIVEAFPTRADYLVWIELGKRDIPERVLQNPQAKSHHSSPFVYDKEKETFIGGHDEVIALIGRDESL